MAESYEDLTERITDRYGISRTEVAITLRHLDIFPDQVPGRTITQSDYVAFKRDVFSGKILVDKIAARLGIAVIPDPEPTNAEKLAASIDMSSRGLVYLTEYQIAQLVKGLEEDGVKAPGGDGE